MKKFQQGGVSVYNVPQGIVQPNIPNSPVINAPLIPVVDMSPYLNAQMDQQRRKEVYDRVLLRQQQTQANSDQKTYFSVYDELFGELHNPAQTQIIDAAKKKYRVDVDKVLGATDPQTVKAELGNVMRMAQDPDVKRVLAEVQVYNKYATRAMPQLTEEEVGKYISKDDEYHTYSDTKVPFDMKTLDKNFYNRTAERAIKQEDFNRAFTNSLNLFQNGIDPTNPADLNTFGQAWASRLEAQNKDQALKQGYIEYLDGSNVPVPTQKGQEMFMNEINLRQRALQAGRDQKLEDATATAEMRRRVNPPRGRSSNPAVNKQEDDADVLSAWEVIMSQPAYEKKYGAMDPMAPGMEWLYDYILSRTDAQGVFTGTNDMRTVGRELDDIIRNVYTPKFNPAPAVSPSGIPVAPPASNQTATKPAGTWEFGPDGKRRQVQ